MSASFNASLWHAIGDTISTEGRAFYNVGGLNGECSNGRLGPRLLPRLTVDRCCEQG